MQRLSFSLLIMTLVLACAQGTLDQNEVKNKIIGGKNEIGFKAVVLSLSANQELCTGSLIAPNLVLTAAHCIFDRSTMQDNFAQSVSIGSRLGGGMQIEVAKSIAHPEYKKPKGEADYENYDIALLVLRNPVIGIDPLPISALRAQAFIGKELLAVGFGLNNEARQSGAGIKRSVSLTVSREIEGRFVAEKNGNDIQDTCSGDSGGPGFVNINGTWTILGTVKRGEIEGCIGLTYYVQVAGHLTWINRIVQEQQIQALQIIGQDAFVENNGNAWQNSGNHQPQAEGGNRNASSEWSDAPGGNTAQGGTQAGNTHSAGEDIDPRDGCALNGYYGDGPCDSFCLYPDPDCEMQAKDECFDLGFYGDGECDTFCPNPDPDCVQLDQDLCQAQGDYGDGSCDRFCPNPDPDCHATENSDQSNDHQQASPASAESDFCALNGYYHDGICDQCDQPDPDCDQANVDMSTEQDDCESYGFYGDGECDTFCPNPDPDCE
jgi:hypothetical protein